MLKSTSQVIDQAMAPLWETKVKFVNVSFSIEKLGRSRSLAISDTGRRLRHAKTDSHDRPEDSREIDDQPIEWVKVTLSAVPGVNMDDVDENEPTRKKDHRRVPSTIAIEEVKAAALKGEAPPGLPLKGVGQSSQNLDSKAADGGDPKPTDALAGELWAVKKERIRRSSIHGKSPSWDLRSVSKITFIIILFFFFYPSLDIGGMINAYVQMCVCVCARVRVGALAYPLLGA